MTCNLIIASEKNYSSWSLRGWLLLRWAGIDFVETQISLAQPGYGLGRIDDVKAMSPNGLVPALQIGNDVIWDTMAIAEWAAEHDTSLWPADPLERAKARSVTAEMHSGFVPLRRDLPMNILRRCAARDLPEETLHSIARVHQIWWQCLSAASGGPYLFGQKSLADAFFLPVATRFRTYSIAMDAACQTYCDTLLADSDFREWEAACVPDSWDIHGFSVIDGLYCQEN